MPTLRRWTEDQISNLKKLGQKHPAAQIAEQLGRSPSATAVKAHELKLSSKIRRQTTEEPAVSGVDPGPAGFDWQE